MLTTCDSHGTGKMHLPLEFCKEMISSGGGGGCVHRVCGCGDVFTLRTEEGVWAGVGGVMYVQRLVVLPKLMDYLGMYVFGGGE